MARKNDKNIYENAASGEQIHLFREVVKRYMHNKAAVLGLIIFAAVLFVILFANFLIPPKMVTAYDARAKLLGPSAAH